MNALSDLLAGQRRLLLLLATGLALAGALCWVFMPRQEDPTFPYRNGLLLVPFPGADATSVEELVVEPVEDALAKVDGIRHVVATARRDVAVVSIQLADHVYDTEPIWQDVRTRLDDVAHDFPDEVLPYTLDDRTIDLQGIVLAVTGSDDLARLDAAADRLEDALRRVRGVRDVVRTGDPGEQIVVHLDDAAARRHQVAPGALAERVRGHASTVPAGTLAAGGTSVGIDARTEARSIEALASLPVSLPSGGVVSLADLAEVRREPVTPSSERMRWDGQAAVAVGVIPSQGLDVVRFGADIDAAIDEIAPSLAPLTLHRVADQPTRVRARLSELGGSLLQGVAVVALVLFAAMGLRLGGVVATIVPLVTMASLALYAASGGVLQQISIAGLVLALGLLVDNGIVIAERIQWRIDHGQDAEAAARATVAELAVPLLSATGTTVASFIPLLLSEGSSGDFTRAIPQLVILTLIVSYVAALTVTPTLAAWTFRASASAGAPVPPALQAFSRLPVRAPWRVALLGLAVVGASLSAAPFVRQQFFPMGDRDQLVIDLELVEGTHLDTTDAAARALESALLSHPEVRHVATFVGRSTPRFYYNLPARPNAPQLAQLLVHTSSAQTVDQVAEDARRLARELTPGSRFVARPLEQGPPVAAPVEVRLFGDDPDTLWKAANAVHRVLREAEGTVDVRHDLGSGAPTWSLEPSDAALVRHGVTRRDVALALLGRTRGLPAGSLRTGDDPLPIVVRSGAGERSGPFELEATDVWSAQGPLPLAALASPSAVWAPAAITRRDGRRLASVQAQLQGGTDFSTVQAAVAGPVDDIARAHGLTWAWGGASEGSGEANSAIFVAAPLGAAMLLGFLLAQFRSFRRVSLVLLTIPLAAAGVVPGLLLFDQPFGFNSLLGVFALIGIVVNNAIILIDYIDTRHAEGLTVPDAVAEAIEVRLRPILLTTATTIAGLVPLLYSSSTLWPPLASAMISGLLASTVLTLWVVPAGYVLLFTTAWRPRGRLTAAFVTAMVALTLVSPARAAGWGLEDALQAAEVHSRALASLDTSVDEARAQVGQATARILPKVLVDGTFTLNDRAIVFDPGAAFDDVDPFTPSDLEPVFAAFHDAGQVAAVFDTVRQQEAGQAFLPDLDPIEVRKRSFLEGGMSAVLPIVDAEAWMGISAAVAGRRAAEAGRDAGRQQVREGVARAFLSAVLADRAVEVTQASVQTALDHLRISQSQVDRGVAPPLAVLEAERALSMARRAEREASTSRLEARLALANLTGWPEDARLDAPDAEPLAPDLDVRLTEATHRPDARAAEETARAAHRQELATGLGWLPTLDASFRGSLTQNQGFQDGPAYWTLNLTARWTLVDGGLRHAQLREATARRKAAELSAAQAQDDAVMQVRVSWARYETATVALEARNQEAALAEEALRVATARLEQGQGTWMEARDALLEAQRARLGALQGQLDVELARVALEVASGRFVG